MNFRTALILSSITLATIAGCKKKERTPVPRAQAPVQTAQKPKQADPLAQNYIRTFPIAWNYATADIETADIDLDGDQDLIVGVIRQDRGYVVYKLINDGKGNYR